MSAARRRVAILGSTGSVGTQALDLIARHPDRFEVVALAAGKRVDQLKDQAQRFGARFVATADDGPEGLIRVAIESRPDVLLAATDGFVSFDAVFAAAERGTDIAIANKELIVSAGDLLAEAARKGGSRILPVDSEHSAIFQCLLGEKPERVAGIILTASGGPFWRTSARDMQNVTLAAALQHPTWQMGVKNTVDSATMMNKGLEVIEASRLFAIPGDRISILVHPQSIAHGMVVFSDGSVKAQLAPPDMRLPIGYALAYPDRLDEKSGTLDALASMGANLEAAGLRYEFERPDLVRFPCVRLAYEALAAGGTMPAALSAANEIAVQAFVDGTLAFARIPYVIEEVMHSITLADVTKEGILATDRAARDRALGTIAAENQHIEV
ncbi:MAG: 1-deoxy-D-xylulose-5-phosphate reductoisomerase [Candidatus Eremiobacteraeota bacterium]|nr:1-deoxy-D-xylulose-5-phosphate reductoisomerase [Candidatus Eremiobacteraeota bacterium]